MKTGEVCDKRDSRNAKLKSPKMNRNSRAYRRQEPLDDYVTCKDYALLWKLVKQEGRSVICRYMIGDCWSHRPLAMVRSVGGKDHVTEEGTWLCRKDCKNMKAFMKECEYRALEFIIPTKLK